MIKLLTLFIIIGFKFSIANQLDPILQIHKDQKISLDEFVNQILPGDVLVLGESHASPGDPNLDQKKQVQIIQALVEKYKSVSVGMEFVEYTKQPNLDLYLKGQLSEVEFLNQIRWGQNPFEDYKLQINLPLTGVGSTFALNAPKEVTNFVGKNGIEKLSAQLASYLPPEFQVGSGVYKNRFFDQMSFLTNHGANLEYYFEAQSIWDDTMAWNASEIMKKAPSQILVIIVGQFHVMYGDGLPERLKARGIKNVITMVQSSSYSDLNTLELKELLNHPTYGVMADYYW